MFLFLNIRGVLRSVAITTHIRSSALLRVAARVLLFALFCLFFSQHSKHIRTSGIAISTIVYGVVVLFQHSMDGCGRTKAAIGHEMKGGLTPMNFTQAFAFCPVTTAITLT